MDTLAEGLIKSPCKRSMGIKKSRIDACFRFAGAISAIPGQGFVAAL